MNTKSTEKEKFLSFFFKNCTEKASGTFFLVTENNKAIQMVIEQGILTGYLYGQNGGQSALDTFKNIAVQKFSFSSDLIMPMEPDATIENSIEAMETLGFKEYQNEISKRKVKQENNKTIIQSERRKEDRRVVGMYRGQPIYAKKEEITSPKIERRKGERRITGIYRGQPIYAKD